MKREIIPTWEELERHKRIIPEINPAAVIAMLGIKTAAEEIQQAILDVLQKDYHLSEGKFCALIVLHQHGEQGVAPSVLAFDIWVMLAVALACLPIFFTGSRIARWEGALFIGLYAAYLAYLVLAAQQHEALTTYGWVLAVFVLPVVTLTLLVVSWREWRAIASARQQREGRG